MDELSNHPSNNSKHSDNFDEDIFDDSIFLENLESFDVKETPNGNKGDSKTDLNVSALCCDEELNGYDKLTGQTWIYPTNYPVRDYQFNIIKAAMLKNCLVSLPTGLGKTFIAAVIMYNFYRWYPLGKIIFTAPTRPLVAQQIEACYNIVAMPPKDTIEMTGQMPVNTRKVHWKSKRVFFATPQVIYNDIKSGMCPGDKIKCLVFDEAHKARGNYAYGNIIATLTEMGHKIYRVLALSATPGNKIEDVIHVVKRLHISHLELRTENCLDVRVYSHARKINTVVIELGPELSRLRQQYVEILDGYNRKLKNFNVVQNLGNLSKGRVVMLYKEFQNRDRGARHPQHNYIMRTFTLLITLYHGLELLVKHGARVFLNFFDEHPEKTWVQFDKDLTSFFDKLRDQLGVDPLSFDRSILPDGTIPEIPSNLNFGHPKFDKLKDIMLEHFNIAKQKGQVTKAIVFCEYRESVNLVHCLLLQCRPTIVPEMFVGQGSGKDGRTGVSQKQQLRVMRKFRGGSCNTLVCTCVAEEGLDVGAVDLILCFDVSTRSPVRLVQRCGRTGRERSGQVFILVTEGREHTTLLDCMRQSDGLNNRILKSEEVKKNLYKSNPRMLPRDFMPECQQMYITVNKELNEKNKKTKDKTKEKSKGKLQKGQQDLISMFQKKASSSKTPNTENKSNEWVTKEEFNKVFPKGYRECNFFPQSVEYWTMSKESLTRDNKTEPLIKLSSSLGSQKDVHDTYAIGHSSDALLLTELLQPKQEVPTFKSPVKKDGDIRVLFSKTTKSIKDYTKSMKELGINNNLNISTEVLNLLVDLSLENTAMVKPCYICLNVCKCPKFCKSAKTSNLPNVICSRSQPVLPDINLIDNMNAELLILLANNNDNKMEIDKNNSLLESRISLEYSNILENRNVSEDDCIFEENDIFDDIDVSPETRPQLGSHNIKRLDESRKSVLNSENEKVIIENDETCDNDNIFEDHDCFEDMDIPVKLTSASSIPMNPSNDLHTSKIINKSLKDGTTGNINNNANFELDDDTIIIDSQEICEKDIFEDNDLFEDDISIELKSAYKRQMNPTDVHTTKKKYDNDDDESIIKDVKTENKDELETDTIIIDSPEICDYNNIEENDLYERIKRLKDNTNQIVDDYDIFEDDDIFEDIKIRDDLTSTKSKNLDDVIHVPKITPESTTQILEEENDINTINLLKYFHLNSISDIFQDSDVEGFEGGEGGKEESVDTIKGKRMSLLNQTEPKNNDNNLNAVIKVECPLSPSLLSNRSSSPILGSQKRRINLSLNKPKKELNRLSLSENKRPISIQEKTSTSPLTEPDHRKTMKSLHQVTDEVIVLDSDDEIFEDDSKDCSPQKDPHTTIKRKFQEDTDHRCESPYFRKKLKLNENSSKPSTVKEKILAALTYHQNPEKSFQNNNQINFVTTKSPTFKLRKENRDPLINDKIDKDGPKSKINMLQVFQHRSKSKSKAYEKATNVTRKITYIDDDDFETEVPLRKRVLKLKNERTTNAKKVNEFLDVEAELSSDGASEDERSDDSAGSLIHFICDEAPGEDIHGIYLQSVKSPVKGVFKVPQLPPLKKDEVLSQYVEPDTYEMDSFCVDSHIETLNETTEMSELEIAEMILKERRKEKKTKSRSNTQKDEDSPIIRKNYRKIKRQINSDSEDSS